MPQPTDPELLTTRDEVAAPIAASVAVTKSTRPAKHGGRAAVRPARPIHHPLAPTAQIAGEPLTRIDIVPLTTPADISAITEIERSTRRRRFLRQRDALARRMSLKALAVCRGTSLSLVLLLLCLPVALWGALLAYTLRPEWVQTIIQAFHLFAPIYMTLIVILGAAGRWRATRELGLAVVLLMLVSYAVALEFVERPTCPDAQSHELTHRAEGE